MQGFGGQPHLKSRRKLKQQSKPETAVKGKKSRILQGQNKNQESSVASHVAKTSKKKSSKK